MLNDTPQWVALYTNPRAEKKTCQNLQELGYEAYVPLQRKLHKWSDRWKSVEVPLLNSYIFVKMREKDVIPIRTAKGVHHIISWHGKPAVIPDKQIEAMRRMVDAEANLQVMNDEALKKDAYVRIVEGQFAGLEGTGTLSATGFGVKIPVMTRPIAIINDELNRAWFYPKAKITANLAYTDGLYRVHAVVVAEQIDKPKIKTAMIIDRAPSA